MYSENPIIALISIVLNIYWWVVMAAVIVSWLAAFNVINPHNNGVRAALRILYALTEPVFRPIRKVIPAIAGMDFSPFIVLILLSWVIYSVLPWINRHIGY